MKDKKRNPVWSKSYRDNFIERIKEKENQLPKDLKVNMKNFYKIMEGKLKEYPYIGFYEISIENLIKEINTINKSISIAKRSDAEKKIIKSFKSYLRSFKNAK